MQAGITSLHHTAGGNCLEIAQYYTLHEKQEDFFQAHLRMANFFLPTRPTIQIKNNKYCFRDICLLHSLLLTKDYWHLHCLLNLEGRFLRVVYISGE